MKLQRKWSYKNEQLNSVETHDDPDVITHRHVFLEKQVPETIVDHFVLIHDEIYTRIDAEMLSVRPNMFA